MVIVAQLISLELFSFLTWVLRTQRWPLDNPFVDKSCPVTLSNTCLVSEWSKLLLKTIHQFSQSRRRPLTRAFSWLKVPASAFTFENQLDTMLNGLKAASPL